MFRNVFVKAGLNDGCCYMNAVPLIFQGDKGERGLRGERVSQIRDGRPYLQNQHDWGAFVLSVVSACSYVGHHGLHLGHMLILDNQQGAPMLHHPLCEKVCFWFMNTQSAEPY